MQRTTTTLALLALAGTTGLAHAQAFIPMNSQGKNYNSGRSNTTAEGVVAFDGFRDNGDPVTGLWEWRTDTVYEMPQPTDDFGNALEFEIFQFRPVPAPERGPGDPVKGISIGLIKKPIPAFAAVWDTSGGAPGSVYELPNSHGANSWATSTSVGGGVIGGALYGDLDGNGNSRHAAVWLDGGDAQLLPVPTGTNSSEIWDVTPSGEFACGGVSDTVILSNRPKSADKAMNAIRQYISSGIIDVVEPDVADADSIVFTKLTADGAQALALTLHDDDTSKGGLYQFGSETFTLLDGGDINGDGQINLFDLHDSDAIAFSADATVIGGSYTLPGGVETAAFWTAADGHQMHDLASYLQNEGVIGLDGWHLTSITGVSADGTVFSGSGYDAAGFADVWVAVVPTPVTLAPFAAAGLGFFRRRRRAF